MNTSRQALLPQYLVLLAIGLGTFMGALDSSVVNTILPLVSQGMQASVAAVEWVVTVYLLVLSGVLLSFGRLGDLQGHKRVYLAGFGIFMVSSISCGLATNIPLLVTWRGIQALGAAMLSANSPAILTKAFPPERRGQALGLQATMTYLGLTAGPSLGGWLAGRFGWQAVFFINIPVSLLAILAGWRFIADDHGSHSTEKFDLPGAGLFLAGLVALLLGLNQGHSWGWASPAILGLLAAAALLLFLFLVVETRSAAPMLDLSLFKVPVFALTVSSAVLNYIAVYSVLFLMPFFLIEGRHLLPAQAGLVLTAQPVIMAIVAPLSGAISDRIGTRLPSAFGMAVLAAGALLLSRLGEASPMGQVMAALAVVGFGTGVFISPNNSALMGSAPRHRQGIAAGVLATARNMGMVLGVGLTGAIFTTFLGRASAQGSPHLFSAIQYSFVVAAVIAATGAVTSFARGQVKAA